MAESSFKLNIKTAADLTELERARRGVSDLADGVKGLGKFFDDAAASKMGSEKMSFGLALKAAPMIREAWDLGTQVGTALGDAITRVAERGFNMDAILGRYDARFDESIARWRDGVDKLYKTLDDAPPQTLLDTLNKIGEAAKAAAGELEHLAELEKMRTDAQRQIEDEIADADMQAIRDNPDLTEEQKEEDVAALQKQRLLDEAQRGDADRLAKETAALDKEELARNEAAEASAKADEQRQRMDVAREQEKKLQRAYNDGGGEGEYSVTEHGRKWADDERARRGWDVGGIGEEQKVLDGLGKAKEEKEAKLGEATTERRHLQDVNAQAAEDDWGKTNRDMAKIDENLATKQHERRMIPPVDTAAIEAAAESAQQASDEVGRAAKQVATTTADSSQQIAGDMRQMAGDLDRSLSAIQAAVAANSQAIQAISQRTEQVAQAAAAALNATADLRNGNRPYNR